MATDSGARFAALTQKEPRWIDSQLALVESVCSESARILDVGSGTGDLARRLASEQRHIVALEPDRAMFELLLERLLLSEHASPYVTPVPLPFQDYSSPRPFDIITAFSVFAFLTHSEQARFVEWASSLLEESGLLILSVIFATNYTQDLEWTDLASHEIGSAQLDIRVRNVLSDSTSIVQYEYSLVINENVVMTEVVQQELHPIERESFFSELQSQGFQVRALYGDWSGGMATATSRFAIVVAERI